MPKQMCFRHVPLERKLVKQSLLLNSTFPHHCNFHSRSTTGVNQRPRTRATLSFSTQSSQTGPSDRPASRDQGSSLRSLATLSRFLGVSRKPSRRTSAACLTRQSAGLSWHLISETVSSDGSQDRTPNCRFFMRRCSRLFPSDGKR